MPGIGQGSSRMARPQHMERGGSPAGKSPPLSRRRQAAAVSRRRQATGVRPCARNHDTNGAAVTVAERRRGEKGWGWRRCGGDDGAGGSGFQQRTRRSLSEEARRPGGGVGVDL